MNQQTGCAFLAVQIRNIEKEVLVTNNSILAVPETVINQEICKLKHEIRHDECILMMSNVARSSSLVTKVASGNPQAKVKESESKSRGQKFFAGDPALPGSKELSTSHPEDTTVVVIFARK